MINRASPIDKYPFNSISVRNRILRIFFQNSTFPDPQKPIYRPSNHLDIVLGESIINFQIYSNNTSPVLHFSATIHMANPTNSGETRYSVVFFTIIFCLLKDNKP